MNPEQAHFLAQTVGQNLQREWMLTYKVITAIPENKKDWKPEPTSRSAWELATHMAQADVGFLNGIYDLSYANAFPKVEATSIHELGEWYKHELPKTLERVLALDAEHLSKPVQFFTFNWPAAQFVFFCNNHMIHHRGQLAAYLRPMGGKVPSIYGGSADEPMKGA
jgi:uncharacterized damage-inducible protein DinB